MKVLLVNPASILDEVVLEVTSDVPPLGLMDVGTQLRAAGHDVSILDASVQRLDVAETARRAIETGADVIGMGALSPNYQFTLEVARLLREGCSATLVLGGVHATTMTRSAIDDDVYDYVIAGEADQVFPQLLEAIPHGDRPQLPGVCWKRGDELRQVPAVRPAELGELEMRDWNLVDLSLYRPSPASYRVAPAISTIHSRGCVAGTCIFCAARTVFGKGQRQFTIPQVRQELTTLVERGIRDINFVDICYTADRHWTLESCNILRELGLGWNITTRCDVVDAPLLRTMRASGCYQIGYGIEAGTQQDLDRAGKNYTMARIQRAITDTMAAGIEAKCFFTIGYPWQKREDIQATIDFAKRLDSDVAIFSVVNPYPGTELYRRYGQQRHIELHRMRHRSGQGSISEHFSSVELEDMMDQANRSYYMRPGFALRFALRFARRVRSPKDLEQIVGGVRYLLNK